MSHATQYEQLCLALQREPRRWVVTGAAGFIGSALVETLLSLGQSVIGVDNFSTGHRGNLDEVRRGAGEAAVRFEFIEGDICDADVCRRVVESADIVLHQAALGSVPRSIDDPLASHLANVNGWLTLALAARDAGVGRLVYASSSSVYGDHPALPKVESAIGDPMSPYAATKRIDEIYAHVLHHTYGLQCVGLRYFNIYGRRQDPEGPYAAVIPRWIARMFSGDSCQVFGDGTNSRDFCYIDNAVQANLLAGTGPERTHAEVYNVGCGDNTSLLELFEGLRGGVSAHAPGVVSMEPMFGEPRAGDVAHSQADISKIREHLGYDPAVRVVEGLERTVDWFAAGYRQRGAAVAE